jgi:serine/threonine protein kinase
MASKEDDESTWKCIDYDAMEIGEIIGGGGVGVIYKGFYKRNEVAIKTFFDPRRVDDKIRKDFLDELLVMSKLKHSNIVELIGACTSPTLFFVMELCEASLFHILHTVKEQFSMKQNYQVCIDVGCAMEHLHSLSPVIIHRDLKSHNILRSFSGVYKICDFGQVKVKSTAAGTPIYMAPELFLNSSYNKSVDAYSFGMLVWEIFNQEIPFYMLEVADIRQRVIDGDRPRLNSYSLPTGVSKMIKSCWSQTSDDRPNFSEIVDQLLDLNDNIQESKAVDNVKSAGDALDSLLLK